jgi:hypothetical protein
MLRVAAVGGPPPTASAHELTRGLEDGTLLVGVELGKSDGLARKHARGEAQNPWQHRPRRARVAVTTRSV